MDYSTLLDDDILAFVARTNDLLPSGPTSIAEARARYDQMAAAMAEALPPDLRVEDRAFGGVPCTLFEPKTPSRAATLIYIHGGGFVLGSPKTHSGITAEIAASLKLRVISVDYRLAPEHQHPAQFDDCMAVLRAVSETFAGNIVLAGDSAGGCLSANLAHAARGTGVAIAGQVLIYPMLGGDLSEGSYITHANAPLLGTEGVRQYDLWRGGPDLPVNDPSFYPLQDSDYSNLPPSFVSTAECDPLSGDGEIYVNRITDAGGKAILIAETGLVHAHLRARHDSPRARAAFDRIIGAIDLLADGIWPY